MVVVTTAQSFQIMQKASSEATTCVCIYIDSTWCVGWNVKAEIEISRSKHFAAHKNWRGLEANY